MGLHFSDTAERARVQATEVSKRWKHHYLSTEHWLYACCSADPACRSWLARRGLSLDQLEEEILKNVPEGDEVAPWEGMVESPRLRRIMPRMAQEDAESRRSMRIEASHVVSAILREGRGLGARILRERGNNDLEACRQELLGGPSAPSVSAPSAPESGSSAPPTSKGKEKHLTKYARDLVELARQGKVDPVVGRVEESRRVLQILTRKTKSNPVLIGEAGVGKTAVVWALALRIAEGQVPDALKNRRLMELSISSMIAGAKHRGEFEERLEGVVREAMEDPSIILFIDELHTLVGAGDSRGGNDASNILKPALARGDFPVLGATTTDEYRKYIEADPALERRFQPVMVGEPSEAEAFEILKGLAPRYEAHHGVKFKEAALLAAVKLSVRFVPDRNLPDKAIDLIDEAAAQIKTRSGVMDLSNPVYEVSEDVIAEVVSNWTGIPVARMTAEESERLLEMEGHMAERVVGQYHAVEAVAKTIRVVRMGLVSPTRPGGVFLFLGPSGVGKTELGKTLADFLFGSDKDMVRLDMSEYHDKHSLARLIGPPPGYVGYDEEGQLTGAVRKKPYCVVLLDEVEKAHPEVFDIFLQVFDDGRLTDSKGRTVNFTNTIIIMTSNLGSRDVLADPTYKNEGVAGELDSLPPLYQKALRGHFRPELLNRIDEIVVFRALDKQDLVGIVQINLAKTIKQVRERDIELIIEPDAVEFVLEHGYQANFGARPLQRAIHTHVQRPLAEEMLRQKWGPGTKVYAYRAGDRLAFATDGPSGPSRGPAPPPAPATRPLDPNEIRPLGDTFGNESVPDWTETVGVGPVPVPPGPPQRPPAPADSTSWSEPPRPPGVVGMPTRPMHGLGDIADIAPDIPIVPGSDLETANESQPRRRSDFLRPPTPPAPTSESPAEAVRNWKPPGRADHGAPAPRDPGRADQPTWEGDRNPFDADTSIRQRPGPPGPPPPKPQKPPEGEDPWSSFRRPEDR